MKTVNMVTISVTVHQICKTKKTNPSGGAHFKIRFIPCSKIGFLLDVTGLLTVTRHHSPAVGLLYFLTFVFVFTTRSSL